MDDIPDRPDQSDHGHHEARKWLVCAVVPTKNEQESIAQVIKDIHDNFDRERFQKPLVIVVDDSTDETRRRAEEAGAEVLIGGGEGLGTAMFAGLKAAAARDPDFIIAVDGDGQADAQEIERFLEPLIKDEADLVLGSRFKEKGLVHYHYKFINRTGTRILSWILRRFTGEPLTDSHGGLRAMIRPVASELEMLGTHTYVQETIIDAVEKGFRIKEIHSIWKQRLHGKSRVVGNIPKYIFYTLPILLLRSGQHIRMLYSAGIILIATACLAMLVVLIQESFQIKQMFNRLPAFVFITTTITLGFQFFFFGLVLQLLKQMKYNIDRGRRYRYLGIDGTKAGAYGDWITRRDEKTNFYHTVADSKTDGVGDQAADAAVTEATETAI